jgi:hypothetical protein
VKYTFKPSTGTVILHVRFEWSCHGGEDVDAVFLGCDAVWRYTVSKFRAEDGHSTFLQNSDIYAQVNMVSWSRTTLTTILQ